MRGDEARVVGPQSVADALGDSGTVDTILANGESTDLLGIQVTATEAAECVAAFQPTVVTPYHYRESDLSEFDAALEGSGVEVRKAEFSPGGGE